MSQHFEIGEIAIIVNCMSHPHENGSEVEIIGPFVPICPGFFGHAVRLLDGSKETCEAAIECLRKKPKRRECDKLVSWDDMPWRPETVGGNINGK